MITRPDALLAELQSRGLVATDAGAVADETAAATHPLVVAGDDRPWYLHLLLGMSGWLAGVFLLCFVGLLLRPNSALEAGLIGVVLLAAARGLFAADRRMARAWAGFVTQLAMALSVAGQCLLLYAMNPHATAIGPVAASAVVLQVVLVFAMPQALHRSLSTFFATIAWALAVRSLFGDEAGSRHGHRQVAVSLGHALAGWLIAWLPVGAGVAALLWHEPAWMARGSQPVVRPVLTGSVVGLAFATIASSPFESLVGTGAMRHGWLAFWPLLSALAALGATAAGFALRNRALMGACAMAALLHVVHFYYEIDASLLLKSLLLLTMGGAALLGARALLGERG